MTNKTRDDRLLVGIIALLAVTFAYSVVVSQTILLWAATLYPLLIVYFLWRFVRAHERIATAMEA
jgi:phage shock protein PspC (stress-responsive transcriptional regulator)